MIKPYNPYKDIEYFARRHKAPQPVSETLQKISSRNNKLAKGLDRYQFTLKWQEIVNEKIAKIAKPSHFRGNTLVLHVPSSAHAQELSFIKYEIIDATRPYLSNKQKISDIAFEVR